LPKKLHYHLIPTQQGYLVDTDIDFVALNDEMRKHRPTEDGLSPGSFIASIADARAEMMLCCHYMSEFMTSTSLASAIRLRFQHLFERRSQSSRDLSLFREIAFPEGRSLKEVLNRKERSFAEFMVLMEKARKLLSTAIWFRSISAP
jgi:hypothetical protein